MRPALVAFVAGLLFAFGLTLAGMTLPAKVVAFLDLTGDWDPSLAFVMGGAILVYMPIFRFATRMRAAWSGQTFQLPTRNDLDPQLLAGAALFGIGWGLGGYCPGPGLTASGAMSVHALTFTAALLTGFVAHTLLFSRK